MDKITVLKRERAAAVAEMRGIHEAAEADNDGKGRALTAEERQEFDRIGSEVTDLEGRIATIEDMRRRTESDERLNGAIHGRELGGSAEERAMDESIREYADAFGAYLRVGGAGLTGEQVRALSGGERRADMIAGTGSLGGFTVPQDFSDKLFSLKIQQGGVRQTNVQVFKTSDGRDMPVPYVSAHAAAEWLAENTAGTKVAETLATTTLHAFVAERTTLVSIQLLQDSAFDLEAYLRGIFAAKIGRLQNAAYVSGNGTGKPTGMVNFAGVASTVAASHTTVTADEVIAWYYALSPVYRVNAQFLIHDSLAQVLRGLKATTGQYLWAPGLTANEPDTLLGRPVVNDPDLAAVGTINNVVGMFADFSNLYVIRDVNEMNIVRLNERYADQLAVGFIGWQRTDGNVIDTAAGAQLKMSAT